jgi:hypothetical protein
MTGGRKFILSALLLGLGFMTNAQITYSGTDEADAFLATGSAGNPVGSDLTGGNFGGAGILVVASAASVKGEFQSVLKFNVTNAVTLFNASFGAGNWHITAISLTLTSNYGTAGGQPNNAMNVAAPKFLASYFTNGLFHLTATGETNSPYQVQASSNLATANWQTIGTATADGGGLIQFEDTNHQTQRFYRLVH